MPRTKAQAATAEATTSFNEEFAVDKDESLLETESKSFFMTTDEKNSLVKEIPPVKFESLTNILDFLTKESDDPIIIKDSIIKSQYKGSSIIKVDLTQVLDGQLDLHLSNPKKWTRLFKGLKADTNIVILNRENQFVVCNEQIKLFLPKQIESLTESLEIPDLKETETICNVIIQKTSRDTILKLAKEYDFIEYLIDDELKAINVPDTAIYILPDYVKDENARKLTSATAKIVLRSKVFLPYTTETYNVIIGHNLVNDSYFSYTTCRDGMLNIEIYEQLDNASNVAGFDF